MCAPVSVKPSVLVWLKVAPAPGRVVRQVSQVCGKFAVTWFGFVVLREVREVAGHAGGAGQAVVIADVAVGAQPRRSCADGQSEARGRVVEHAIGPQRHHVVAVLARGAEIPARCATRVVALL